MIYRALVAVLLQLALWANPALAAPTNIAAQLMVEGPVQAGRSADLAIVMTPAAGWHGDRSNPGDAGLGMQLAWTLPKGISAGSPRFPVPETLLIQGLMNHVYASPYAVLVPLKVDGGVAAGAALPISLDAQWLACTDKVCVPERATLTARLTIGPPGTRDARFDGWRQRLPAPLGSAAKFALTKDLLRVAIPIPASVALREPHLFIAEDKVVAYAAVQSFSREGDLLVAELPRAKFAAIDPVQVTGVLKLSREGSDGLEIRAEPGPVPEMGPRLPSGNGETAPLALLLLSALAGGLLLNVMPCVFPILSLKAISLAKAGGSEAEARADGLAYTAGVVLACLALGALLLALRAGGAEVGWAFQLQEPLVVAALLVLAAALTANFLGLFEFTVPGFAQSGSGKGAFATGLLAAFVATPCTGPFMAAAMGAALLLPVPQGLALFAALGLGIALPFLAIAFVPALRRRLPKPGGWMTTFRRWMALPMGLTALALLWLCWRLGGTFFAVVALFTALVLLAHLIIVGRKQRNGVAARPQFITGLISLTALFVAVLPQSVRTPSSATEMLDGKAFSELALAKARASGKPTFLYFTADWCLTCKVNERVAIERDEVREAFSKSGVQVLIGDWTRRDPAITRFLTAQGVAGVPLYLWYPAGGGAAEQLPQVLTPAMLVERAGAGKL